MMVFSLVGIAVLVLLRVVTGSKFLLMAKYFGRMVVKLR
jgi:uncharacterized membrane-anchored protein